jgi:hypothetical protein
MNKTVSENDLVYQISHASRSRCTHMSCAESLAAPGLHSSTFVDLKSCMCGWHLKADFQSAKSLELSFLIYAEIFELCLQCISSLLSNYIRLQQ